VQPWFKIQRCVYQESGEKSNLTSKYKLLRLQFLRTCLKHEYVIVHIEASEINSFESNFNAHFNFEHIRRRRHAVLSLKRIRLQIYLITRYTSSSNYLVLACDFLVESPTCTWISFRKFFLTFHPSCCSGIRHSPTTRTTQQQKHRAIIILNDNQCDVFRKFVTCLIRLVSFIQLFVNFLFKG
jgi:hypothetical protein